MANQNSNTSGQSIFEGGIHEPPSSSDLGGLARPNLETGSLSGHPEVSPLAYAPPPEPGPGRFKRFLRPVPVLLATVVLGVLALLAGNLVRGNEQADAQKSNLGTQYNTQKISLGDFIVSEEGVNFGQSSVVINGPLKTNGGFVLTPSVQPNAPAAGQLYFDQDTSQLAYYNGVQFVPLGGDVVQSIGGLSGQITLGANLAVTNGQLVVTIPGTAASVNSLGGQTGVISLGSGLAMSGTTLQNSGILNVIAGSNIGVSNDGNGTVTITNTGSGTGTVTSSGGTTGRIPLFTSAQNIEDSLISQSGLNVTVNGDLSVVTGGLSLSNALTVSNGGTGATSLAANGVIIGSGTSALASVAAGGAGLCLLSTAGAPSWAACPGGGGVSSLNGLTGALSVANASAAGVTVTIDDASTSAKGIAQFNATNFSAASGVINTIQNINSGATPTFAGVNTNTITPSGLLTVGDTGQQLVLQGNAGTQLTATGGGFTTTVGFSGSPTANVTYNFDRTAVAGTYTVCSTVGNCAGVGGSVGGSGTNNRLAKFTSTGSTIGDSTITDDAANVTTTVDLIVQGGSITVGVPSSQTGAITFAHNGSANTGTISQGALTGSHTYTLPNATGTFCLDTGNCSGSGSTNTLQAAYDAGSVVATTNNRDIDIVLSDDTVDSNLDIVVEDDSTGFVSISRQNGAGTNNPAQLLLLDNLDGNQAIANGILIQSAAGAITDGIDVSDAELLNALNVGANEIIGTAATINFTSFDVDGSGNVSAGGNMNLSGGGQYQISGTQISSAALSNDANLAKLNASQTFTGVTNAFQNSGNSTNAFNVQNLAGTRILTVDTTNGEVELGLASTLNGRLVFSNVSNANTVTIVPGAPSANRVLTLPNADGILCTDSGNCAGVGSTLQTAYNFSTGGTTPKIKLNSTLNGVDIQDADTTIGADLFTVRESNGAGLGQVMFGVGNTGQVTLQNGANSTAAFRLLTDGGTSVLTGDTQNGQVLLGQGGTLTGNLVFQNATNSNQITLTSAVATGPQTATLPDASGEICLSVGNCSGSGSTNTLQAAYDAGNTINTATARNIAFNLTEQATDPSFLIDLQCDTSCGGNGRFAIQDDATDVFTVSPAGGAANFINSADSTQAFNVENQTGGNLFTVDTSNSRVGIALGSNNTPVLTNQGLEVNGAIRISGTANDTYATPNTVTPTNISARLSVVNSVLGSGSQVIAVGVTDNSDAAARGITVADARAGAHQPSLAVLSPDDSQIGGFSWDGSNTVFLVKNTASGSIGLNVAGTTRLSATTTGVSVNGVLSAASTSSSAFQIQNAGATETMFSADTTARGAGGGNLIKIGNSTGTDGATTILQLDSASADPTSNLAALNGGLFYNSNTNKVSLIENGQVKIICNTTDLGCGTGTVTLQSAYNNSTSPEITLDGTRGALTVRDNATPIGANLLEVQNNAGSTTYLGLTATALTLGSDVDITMQGANAFISNTQGQAGSEAFGAAAEVDSTNGLAIGSSSLVSSSHGTAVGASAWAQENQTVALGSSTHVNGIGSIAIGYNADVQHTDSIALGEAATTTAANQFVMGSSSQTISSVFIGNGVTSGTPAGFTLQGTGGSGSNIAGASVTIAGGRGTGTGNGGDINLQIADPGGSGSSLNSLTSVATISGVDGAATFQNSTNSTSAFRVLNSAGSSNELVGVDATDSILRLLANNTGDIPTFQSDSDTITAREGTAYATINGYAYLFGGCDTSDVRSTTVQYAKFNADGTPGAWGTTTALPTASCGATATTYNGYVYVHGGGASAGDSQNIYYAKPNPDGTISAWSTNVVDGQNAVNSTLVTYNGYIYEVAVGTSSVWYARVNGDGSIGSFTEVSSWLGANRINSVVVAANGFLYVIGGHNGTTTTNTVYYGRFLSSGAVGTPAGGTGAAGTTTVLPTTIEYSGGVVANGYLYVVGGQDSVGKLDDAYYTALGSDGTLGAWTTETNSLPDVRMAGGVILFNNFIYYFGGIGTGVAQTNSWYTGLSRVRIGGGLDLTSYSGENSADGGAGGQLTAGDTFINGTLTATGNAVFRNGLSVLNSLTLKSSANSTSALAVLNASDVPQFSVDTTNTRVYIGNPTADTTGALLVLDTKSDAGDPGSAVNGSMYYNSNSQTFRCYENSVWYDCLPRHKIVLGSDTADSAGACTGYATVFTLPVTSGKVYNFMAQVSYTSAATTTGSEWTINGPTKTFLAFKTTQMGNNDTSEFVFYGDNYDEGACSANTINNTATMNWIEGTVTTSSSGNLLFQVATEVNGSAITAKAGSTLEWW